YAECGHATQAVRVEPARHVQADLAARVHFGRVQVWQIAAEFNVRFCESLKSVFGIAHAVNGKLGVAQYSCRSNEKLFELASALFITPIADPNHVGVFGGIDRKEMSGIGGFVESPRSLNSEAVNVNAADCVAECQRSVEFVQRKPEDFFRIRVCPMMSVVE